MLKVKCKIKNIKFKISCYTIELHVNYNIE